MSRRALFRAGTSLAAIVGVSGVLGACSTRAPSPVIQGSPLPGVTPYAASGGSPPPTQSIQMAVVVVATLPILLVYPFLQRYFTRGVLTGAIKG